MKKIFLPVFLVLFVCFGLYQAQSFEPVIGGIDDIKTFIQNSTGSLINPATSEKQDLTNSKLDTLNNKAFATSTKQDTGNNSLSSIDGKMTSLAGVDYSTEAKQDTGNWLLTDIKNNQTNATQKVQIVDSDGNNLKTEDNVLRVHDTPHYSPELSVHLAQDTATTSTLSVQANKGSKTITLTSAVGFSQNDKIKIVDGANSENDILTIKAVNGNDLTLDRILDADQTAGKVVKKVLINMNVDGSVTNSIFSYKPKTNQNKRITGIHLTIKTTTEPSFEKFGGISALTYGIHLKVKNATGRDQTYWIPFRSNNSFILSGFTYEKETKVGGGEYFTHLFVDIKRTMLSVIPLDDTQEFQVIVQDNLTSLTSLEIKLSMYDESGIVE